ncbi:MAG: bifunctional DNA-binding transcriptional regulator/O6-methylguanine-DNA methyltransferase Ada [Xanthobacter sp.]
MPKEPGAEQMDPRWMSVVSRDHQADGNFVYAVKTTGVYCRPSCPSRTARPENVLFFNTADEAEEAGFRPCLRCQPRGLSVAEAEVQMVEQACRQMAGAEQEIKLEDLASRLGVSPSHFHRRFKALTGLTPKAWQAALRACRVRETLDSGDVDITRAIYDAGFNASSRFYAQANSILGMTPTSYRRGGMHADIHFAVAQCSLGALLVAQSNRGVCAISLGDDPETLVHELQDRFPNAELVGGDAAFEEIVAQVVGFVEAPKASLGLPLDLQGTAFQQRVWQALQQIPPGQTVSYAALARRIGQPKAVRAVAQACGANRIAVAIPCHRVVRTDGALSGYRWGVERKRTLLEREAKS